MRFYEQTQDGVAWEGRGEFGQNDVHRQFAIVFKTPPYRNTQITQAVTVYMQLRRISDGQTSEPMAFQYTPENPGTAAFSCIQDSVGKMFLTKHVHDFKMNTKVAVLLSYKIILRSPVLVHIEPSCVLISVCIGSDSVVM